MAPITLRELLLNEEYKAYFRRPPKAHASTHDVWAIVAISHEGKYGQVLKPTFKEAFLKGKDLLKRPDIHDISIFARNTITSVPAFAPALMDSFDDWCGRCRRPTQFEYTGRKHPALRHAPVIVPGVNRCYFCGIAQSPYHMGASSA